mmetsp:Transcript_71976/g.114109  ORF Transcript_71976/g.114109 Transcript_71976/m.114109 type:complete len:118 (+) Transcript_71976:617-970(+)
MNRCPSSYWCLSPTLNVEQRTLGRSIARGFCVRTCIAHANTNLVRFESHVCPMQLVLVVRQSKLVVQSRKNGTELFISREHTFLHSSNCRFFLQTASNATTPNYDACFLLKIQCCLA